MGKTLPVLEHEDYHGGAVLLLSPDEYARVGSFATEEHVHDPVRDSKSCIEMAVRKAFAP